MEKIDERDNCLDRLEVIGDTILKHCHYYRENGDVNTLATLKSIAETIASEISEIGNKIK
ncbi:MAG: hypothetical protein ACRCZ2_10910 [Fusobacteriaceae bacterium]